MIDLKVLRENPDVVRASQQARGEDAGLVDALAAAAAWFSATTGGSHRDEGIAIHGVVPPYLRERFKRS